MAGLSLQAELWFSDGGYRKTVHLHEAVAEQRALNDSLRDRNSLLDAEVITSSKAVTPPKNARALIWA